MGASTSCLGRHNQGQKTSRRECVRTRVRDGPGIRSSALSLCLASSGHESLDFMCGLLCLRIPEELLPADVLDGRRRWGGSARSFRSADTRLLGGMEHDGIVVPIILATVQRTRNHAVSRPRSRGARGEAVGTTSFQMSPISAREGEINAEAARWRPAIPTLSNTSVI